MQNNIPKMNFHTHTTYCDGKESAESMIQAALQKGFTRLGFSGHCFNTFRPEDVKVWCMSPEGTEAYKQEIRALAKKYEGEVHEIGLRFVATHMSFTIEKAIRDLGYKPHCTPEEAIEETAIWAASLL